MLPIAIKQRYSQLSPDVQSKWVSLQQQGKFEEQKAELSLLSSAECITAINPKSITEIFRTQSPTLATVKKYQGEIKSKAAIGFCLLAVNEFFGAKSGLSDGQIDMLSDLIFSEFYYLTLSDLKYCIRQGLLGRYEEKIYGKATPDVIMRWINAHTEQRASEAEQISYDRHKEKLKEERLALSSGILGNEEAIQKIREIRLMLEAKMKAKEKDWAVHYKTVEEYCKASCMDSGDLRKKWEQEYRDLESNQDVSLSQFIQYKERTFLYEVNNPVL